MKRKKLRKYLQKRFEDIDAHLGIYTYEHDYEIWKRLKVQRGAFSDVWDKFAKKPPRGET